MKVALVYDRVNKWGGAERVLLALNEIFPKAPLYTSLYDKDKAVWSEVFPEVIPSFLQKIPGASKNHEKLALFMPLAFESHNFDDYDLVVSVTSEAAKGIQTSPKTKHICYCLTPTRYLWSHYDDYFKNPVLRNISTPAVGYLKRWDKHAAIRPDLMVAISSEVQKRIKKFYERESKVVFPPVADLSLLKRKKVKLPFKDYYLLVSRLVPYKKVDLAVEAFNRLHRNLVIVGIGSEKEKLQRKAGRNIFFAGELTDEELAYYYENSTALIHPQYEDFGLTAVEAQMFGKPVIAYKAGGVLDTVKERQTGLFFNKQEPNELIRVVKQFEKLTFRDDTVRKNSLLFSKDRFEKEFINLLDGKL